MQQVLPSRWNMCANQNFVISYEAEKFAVIQDAQKFLKSTSNLKLIGQKRYMKQFPCCGPTNVTRHLKQWPDARDLFTLVFVLPQLCYRRLSCVGIPVVNISVQQCLKHRCHYVIICITFFVFWRDCQHEQLIWFAECKQCSSFPRRKKTRYSNMTNVNLYDLK